MRFKFTLAGEDLGELDPETLTLKDAFTIKAESGLTPKRLFDGLDEGDPDCVQTMIWFLRRQQGQIVERRSIDCALSQFQADLVEDSLPTGGAPETSEGAATSTSGS